MRKEYLETAILATLEVLVFDSQALLERILSLSFF